jgi:preprotein translocase subunit YajC
MIFIQILALLALLLLLVVAFFGLWPLFTEKRRPGLWSRLSTPSYWNLSILTLVVALMSGVVFLALSYRDQQRSDEIQLLKRVAKAQEKIYQRSGAYGLIADVLAIDPPLYRREFVINNGDDPQVSYISTARCQLLLNEGRQRGPTCGSPGQ